MTPLAAQLEPRLVWCLNRHQVQAQMTWLRRRQPQRKACVDSARTVRLPGLMVSWLTAMVGPFDAAMLIAPVAMDGEDTANLHINLHSKVK